MAATATIQDRDDRFGRSVVRWIAIALLALLALGVSMESASAQPSPGSYQNNFVGACRDHGGQPKRIRSRVVRCTLGDGTTITCDFNVDPPSCTYGQALTIAYGDAVNAAVNGQVLTVSSDPGQTVETGSVSTRATRASVLTRDDQP